MQHDQGRQGHVRFMLGSVEIEHAQGIIAGSRDVMRNLAARGVVGTLLPPGGWVSPISGVPALVYRRPGLRMPLSPVEATRMLTGSLKRYEYFGLTRVFGEQPEWGDDLYEPQTGERRGEACDGCT